MVDVNKRLQRAREELAVLDQQVVAFADEADETRVRALVSDSPQAAKDYREAEKHADAIAHYEQALRIKPDLTEARNALTRLQARQ